QEMYPYDPKKANTILDQAGSKRDGDGNRFSIKFSYATGDAEAASFSVALQNMWTAFGVKLSIEPVDRASASKKVFSDGDFDAFITPYTSFFDPALGLTRGWSSTALGKPFGNPTGFSSPALDAMFAKAANLTSQSERAAVYNDA